MQTFLPYPDFEASAKVLDYRRLGKQRVEAKQILSAIIGKSNGWRNHPAIKMWIGYEQALSNYMATMILEWVSRGYNNSMHIPSIVKCEYPKWIGNDEFHASHRSNLLRKDEVWYRKFGWNEPTSLPYVWPKEM